MKVNQRLSDGTILNNITQGRYDVVVTDVPAHPTDLLAKLETYGQLLNNAPPEFKLMLLPDFARMGGDSEIAERIEGLIEKMMAPPPAPMGPNGMPMPPGAPMGQGVPPLPVDGPPASP